MIIPAIFNATPPAKGSDAAAGFDLATTQSAWLWPFQTKRLPTGLRLEIPPGCCALVLPRSGIATKRGLAPVNSPGLIDADYRGEILVALHNYSLLPRKIRANERIAQLLFVAHYSPTFTQAESLGPTARQANGFGSTG